MGIHDEIAYWECRFRRNGWASCPLLFDPNYEFVTDNPQSAARSASDVRTLSIGIPHPQYGVMRATVYLTSATSLTRLTGRVHGLMQHIFAYHTLPHLYVGTSTFTDRVGGACERCSVYGLLVYAGPESAVHFSPMTLALWQGTWVPYFEDDSGWVMTGWDPSGMVRHIFKPFGWGCKLMTEDADEERASSCCSRVEG